MRAFLGAVALVWVAGCALANADTDRLVDAMGLPDLIDVFAQEGVEAGAAINDRFLNGQGGSVWAETVRRLYDTQRLDAELRAGMAQELDPDIAAQALLFFESELGQKIVDLEVQARRAMLNPDLEAAAKAAPTAASDAITGFLDIRDLVARNTDTAIIAQTAFFAGLAAASPQAVDIPDIEARRGVIRADTDTWLRGFYALAQSPLSPDEVAIYTAFWDTQVGEALDDALFAAFGASYETLSFGLGQAAGRLSPQNDL